MEISFNNLKEVLKAYGEALVEKYQQGLLDEDAFATGNLLEKTYSFVTTEGYVYEMSLNLPFYWKYIEEGLTGVDGPIKGGKHPHTNWGAYPHILEWVRIKPVPPKPDSRGKVPTPERLAGAITYTIIKQGTEPRNILEKAMEETKDWEKLIDEAITADIEENVDAIMQLIL